MSYIQSLLQSRELADKIRSGEYKSAAKQQQQEAPPGLVRRPTVEAEPAVAKEQDSMQEMLASYLAGIRQKQQAEVDTGGFETRTVEDVEVTRPMSRRDAGFEPVPGTLSDLSAAREAIAAVESRGSGDYAAIGPVVTKGMYKGQRAYGRYQVMEGNIGPWTEEVFGKPMTKEEFMNDPEAQDAVVENQLRKSYEKFGTYDDAASVWFSGQPYNPSSRRSDGFTTVPEYVKKFRRFFVENKGTS